MRYLIRQNINRRAPFDTRLIVDALNGVVMDTTNSLRLPKGTNSEKPLFVNTENGMIRYNTTSNEVEVFQAGAWRALRYKESTQIRQQNLGAGDNNSLYFGPLDPEPPLLTESGSTWGGQNLLVIVENVLQIHDVNYTIVQDPTIPTEVHVGQTSAQANTSATRLYFSTELEITSVSGNGVTVTLTFGTQAANPFAVGQLIAVSEISISGYNGIYTVTNVTTSSVSYANTTTGTPLGTTIGVVASDMPIYPTADTIGAVVTGSASIQANTVVVSYDMDPITSALLSIELSLPLTNTVPASTQITITENIHVGTGYYLYFGSPVPTGKPVTVLHGFDR